jgi:hypothetical protein
MTKNWKKITAEKKLNFFWSKTASYLSLGLHKVCPSYRRSLQLSKEAIQHFKTWTFTNFFLLLWVIFCPPGSRSTGPIESGSNPDPKHITHDDVCTVRQSRPHLTATPCWCSSQRRGESSPPVFSRPTPPAIWKIAGFCHKMSLPAKEKKRKAGGFCIIPNE